ncbi:WD40 repeat domain-containing protein [Streptomyces aurantiogriseus]|uniref:WD40 repeat domain-containing protein n=1 Tax=Streptomyces aurantiogriseus TaxID=66870 RepID=UPI0035715EA5
MSDPSRPTAFGQPLTGHTSDVSSVASSPTARTPLSAGYDGTVRLWGIDVDRAVARICDVTRTTLNRQQWLEPIPGLPFDPPCT